MLDSCLEQLPQYQNVDTATLKPLGPEDAAIQRWFQLAIQCCLDLGDSLLGKLGQPEPPRYRDVFPELVRLLIIDAPLARAMEGLTDYRNTLAHGYIDLEPAETVRQAMQGLRALAEFGSIMSRQ